MVHHWPAMLMIRLNEILKLLLDILIILSLFAFTFCIYGKYWDSFRLLLFRCNSVSLQTIIRALRLHCTLLCLLSKHHRLYSGKLLIHPVLYLLQVSQIDIKVLEPFLLKDCPFWQILNSSPLHVLLWLGLLLHHLSASLIFRFSFDFWRCLRSELL